MNKLLKKETSTPAQKLKKRRGYAKKYMSNCRTLCVTLNNDRDADILEWLDSLENRSDTVREVLRKEAGK